MEADTYVQNGCVLNTLRRFRTMSRSYKHTPYCGGRNKFSKNQANRRVRRNKMDLSLPKGGYKKFIVLGKFVIIGMDL